MSPGIAVVTFCTCKPRIKEKFEAGALIIALGHLYWVFIVLAGGGRGATFQGPGKLLEH